MSHKHSGVLRLLLPVKLTGAAETDLELEGEHLDLLQDRAEALRREMHPSTAYETLEDWERVCGLAPGIDDPLQLRQNRVQQKLREVGRLDLPYFKGLAEALGFTVVIEELKPFMPGWGEIGEELMAADADWCWRVYIIDDPGVYFRIGESEIGEPLSFGYQPLLQSIFEDLKPADTFVEFEQVI